MSKYLLLKGKRIEASTSGYSGKRCSIRLHAYYTRFRRERKEEIEDMGEFSYRKKIDNEKARKYFAEHPELKKSEIAAKAGISASVINNAITYGETRIAFWNLICDGMGVSRDFFDIKEPEQEAEVKHECLIGLEDIQLSLNKIEILLTEQNKLLRGKLEKGGNLS